MLGDNHIHRVYVCEDGRVKGVITPTDILRWVAVTGGVKEAPAAVCTESHSASQASVAVK